MLSHHSVVWIEHFEAHIIHFDAESSQDETVTCDSALPNLHVKAGKTKNGATVENDYFNEIIDALHDSTEILLMGPDSEKDVFMHYAEQHQRPIAEKIIATLTDEIPTDPQMLKFAKEYFIGIDLPNLIPAKALTSKKSE